MLHVLKLHSLYWPPGATPLFVQKFMLHLLKLHSLSWPPGRNSSGCIEVYPSSVKPALSLLTTRGDSWLYRSLYNDSTSLLSSKSSSIQHDVIVMLIGLQWWGGGISRKWKRRRLVAPLSTARRCDVGSLRPRVPSRVSSLILKGRTSPVLMFRAWICLQINPQTIPEPSYCTDRLVWSVVSLSPKLWLRSEAYLSHISTTFMVLTTGSSSNSPLITTSHHLSSVAIST